MFCIGLLAPANLLADTEVSITTDKSPGLCIGESITLGFEANETPDSIRWNPEVLFANPTAAQATITPEESVEIILEFYLDGALTETSLSITVDRIEFPEFTTRDTTICEKEGVFLVRGDVDESAFYSWSPSEGLSDTTIANPLATPTEDIVYILTVSSSNGFCTEIDSVAIEVLPNHIEIMAGDTAFVCDDDPEVTLTTFFRPQGSTFEWRPNDGSLDNRFISSPTATVDFTTRYHVHMVTPDGCESRDTVIVRLDSLPEFNYAVVPAPREECNKYCPGDFITIFSNPFNPEHFPDLVFGWRPLDGSIRDSLQFQNVSIEANVSQYYIRINQNNACESEDSIFIDVVDLGVDFTPSDTVVCANEPVQVMVDPTDLSEIEWSPAEGISCTDCPNPIITVSETTTFTMEAMKEECCPVSISVTVNVVYPPIPIEPLITCPGEPIQILVDSEGYTNPSWSGPQVGDLSCTDCFEPFATVNTTTFFQLTAFDEDGCESRGVAEVDVFPPPSQLEIEVAPGDEIPIGTQGVFELVSFPTVPVDNIVWFYNGQEVESGVRIANISILEEGTNNVITAEMLDENGCPRTVSITISGVEPIFEVPNVFTPGGQNQVNQFFRPIVTNAELFDGSFVTDFKVWNRWGQLVYNNDNNEEGWNGRQGSSMAPPDVYVYVIEITLPNGRTRSLKGDVTLLR